MDNSEISIVYKDDEYELGQMDGIPCLVAGGRHLKRLVIILASATD